MAAGSASTTGSGAHPAREGFDEVRDPQELAPKVVEVGEDEIEQALQLADRMTIEDLSGFRDEYRQALEDIIAAKADGKPLPSPSKGEENKAGRWWT